MAVLTPVSKIQFNQFKDLYDPNLPYNQQNLMLQSKMDENTFNQYSNIANEEKNLGFFDKLTGGLENLFSAYGSEMPPVPNLDYGYRGYMPTFDLATGITNTSSASPFLKSVAEIAASNATDTDLVSQLIAEEAAKQVRPQLTYELAVSPEGKIYRKALETPARMTDSSTAMPDESLVVEDFYSNQSALPQILAGQSDFEKNLLEPKVEREKTFLDKGVLGGIGTFISGILPKDPPEVRRVKDFYARNFGVNTAGSVASGIMKGYNPVSGGFLNYMTGGKYGEPMQVGLGRAIQKRISNILGRKLPQTEASRRKVEELRNLQLQEMRDRAAGGESLSSIGKSTFTGKGMAFEAKPSRTFTTPSGQKGYSGGR